MTTVHDNSTPSDGHLDVVLGGIGGDNAVGTVFDGQGMPLKGATVRFKKQNDPDAEWIETTSGEKDAKFDVDVNGEDGDKFDVLVTYDDNGTNRIIKGVWTVGS